MKSGYLSYSKENVRDRLISKSYYLALFLACLLITGCKDMSSGPVIDTEDILPAAVIISPPKTTVQKSPAVVHKTADSQNLQEIRAGKKAVSDITDNVDADTPISEEDEETDLPDTNIFAKGSKVVFHGVGTTFQNDTLAGSSLTWSSDINGELGTGNTLEKNDLDTGTHWIFLDVTDHNKLKSRDSVRIVITDAEELINGPVAEITSLTEGLSLLNGVKVILEGTGVDADGNPLDEENLEWTSNKSDKPLGTGSELDVTGLLPLGEHTITLTVTDQEGNSDSDSVTISIEEAVNELPVAQILSIGDFTSLTGVLNLLDDTGLILKGTGMDAEDGELSGSSLEWRSDVDGDLGTGSELEIGTPLSLGNHTITLTVTDSEGNTDTDSVEISIEETVDEIVNKLPVAKILSIADSTLLDGVLTLLDGITLILKGTGKDAEGNPITGENLKWSSDKDGVLGTGSELEIGTPLSLGNHTITLTVTDSEGNTDTDSVEISIEETVEEIVNKLPVAEILSIADNIELDGVLTLLDGVELILKGTGEDAEGNPISEDNFKWRSDQLIEPLGSGSELDVTGYLAPGEHTIILTVTDSEGNSASDSVEVRINEPPVAKIISHTDGALLSLLGELILEGDGHDPDGDLDEKSFYWKSDVDGDLGWGSSLKVKGILTTVGEHTITLTVTDSDQATDSDRIKITLLESSL